MKLVKCIFHCIRYVTSSPRPVIPYPQKHPGTCVFSWQPIALHALVGHYIARHFARSATCTCSPLVWGGNSNCIIGTWSALCRLRHGSHSNTSVVGAWAHDAQVVPTLIIPGYVEHKRRGGGSSLSTACVSGADVLLFEADVSE
eukprot:6071442-Amphidinium_carterae.1